MSLERYRDLHPQARQMILYVHNYMEKEAAQGVKNPHRAHNRTTAASNITIATLQRILKEGEKPGTPFRTPGRIRKKPKTVTGSLSDYDKCYIIRSIHKFYVVYKKWPSLNVLLTKLQTDINYVGSDTSLRRIIRRLGFVTKRNKTNVHLLIENYRIRLERINFLKKIKQYREENRPIVYTDEMYIREPSTKFKAIEGERVVIVHAASEDGFLPNAFLTFHCASGSDGMDYDKYRNWLQNQLIPNLPPKSVVVLDNATYHKEEYDEAPKFYSKKSDMQAWLADKGILFTPELLKPQLSKLIELHKDQYQKYNIDHILSQHGHDVLRLPTHQKDLNPFEQAWIEIEGYISSENVEWKPEQIKDLAEKKISLIGADKWKVMCEKVKVFEDDYRQSDNIIDKLTESLLDREEGESDADRENGSSS